MATAERRSYRHEAFLWRGTDEFVAGTVPFVLEGLAAGEPVMVAVVRERWPLLRGALGAAADRVHWVDMAELGHNPARIIPAWTSFVQDHEGRPVRGLGEPVWAGRRPAEVTECQLHEALLNVAVHPDVPLWLRCPYDAAGLDADVLAEAERSHPVLLERSQYSGSRRYSGSSHVESLLGSDLPPAPEEVEVVVVGREGLGGLRRRLRSGAAAAEVPAERVASLVLGVHELAANSIEHGGGTAEVHLWASNDAFVCEVRDRGRIADPLVGRHPLLPGQRRGRGVWMANQLCDLVQIRSSSDGTVSRVTAWRD